MGANETACNATKRAGKLNRISGPSTKLRRAPTPFEETRIRRIENMNSRPHRLTHETVRLSSKVGKEFTKIFLNEDNKIELSCFQRGEPRMFVENANPRCRFDETSHQPVRSPLMSCSSQIAQSHSLLCD